MVKGFFIYMAMLSFKQVEFNHGKRDPCTQGYKKYVIFSIQTQNGCTRPTPRRKTFEQHLILF